MNIDEYLAIKNEPTNEVEEVAQTQSETTDVTQADVPEATEAIVPSQPETVEPTETKTEQPEVTYDEFVKTQQELEQMRQVSANMNRQIQQAQVAQQYYDKMMQDPGYAKVFAEKNGLTYIDPQQQAVVELEQKYNDLLLQREIENMQIKYPDFDPKEVIQTAVDRGLNSLEDAYVLSKARSKGEAQPIQNTDVNSLKEQIRQELLNELQSGVDTGTLVGASGGGAKPITNDAPSLSSAELRVAQNMKMSPDEYAKWKNIK